MGRHPDNCAWKFTNHPPTNVLDVAGYFTISKLPYGVAGVPKNSPRRSRPQQGDAREGLHESPPDCPIEVTRDPWQINLG